MPYSQAKNDFGAQQKNTIKKDFLKLNSEVADYKFFFVTDEETYEILNRKYSYQIPDVQIILLRLFEE